MSFPARNPLTRTLACCCVACHAACIAQTICCRLAMHDAEPAARNPHVYVVRPGGLEAGSIPAGPDLLASRDPLIFARHSTHTTRALSLERGLSGVAGFFCVICAPSRPDSHLDASLVWRVIFLRLAASYSRSCNRCRDRTILVRFTACLSA